MDLAVAYITSRVVLYSFQAVVFELEYHSHGVPVPRSKCLPAVYGYTDLHVRPLYQKVAGILYMRLH